MNIRNEIIKVLSNVLSKMTIDLTEVKINLERPSDFRFGDYTTNVALIYSKELSKKPSDLAKEIISKIGTIEGVEKIEIAGIGFINFYLSKNLFASEIKKLAFDELISKSTDIKGKKVLIEYTDPNPFKVFHIGHLMSNAIGESLSRIMEWQGAKVLRANYQGDVGLHVAKAIWGMFNFSEKEPSKKATTSEKTEYIGRAYTFGANKYEDDENVKKEIEDINKKIFEKSDVNINKIYDWGRKISLEHFEEIYKKLGTKFDHYFFESEVADVGLKIVEENLDNGIFEKSDGAIIFPGEKYKLHNRVFINSIGLPIYEAKDLGLYKTKFDLLNPDLSIMVTASEQDAYFDVLFKAISLIDPRNASKMKHISHGMMRFASGKMSSRKGNIITGESLINSMEDLVREKMKDREMNEDVKEKVVSEVAISAIKYSILKQTAGSDIIYDPIKAVSFEGDSGPYLQYACVRANSVLNKAKEEGIKFGEEGSVKKISDDVVRKENGCSLFERLLPHFPEVIERSLNTLEPHHITTYLTELASAFNNFYAHNQIVNKEDEKTLYRLALTSALKNVMEKGLYLLGIKVPEEM